MNPTYFAVALSVLSLAVQAWNAYQNQKVRAEIANLRNEVQTWADGRFMSVPLCGEKMKRLEGLIPKRAR